MTFITAAIRKTLIDNGEQQAAVRGTADERDFVPVVKLFTPDANATWLLTELDPVEPDIAFGLCDLGLGCPELGFVSLSELESVRGPMGLAVERDRYFVAKQPLSNYANRARIAGYITA